eukprot:1318662-Alexandrium_andersonii.AAC.1
MRLLGQIVEITALQLSPVSLRETLNFLQARLTDCPVKMTTSQLLPFGHRATVNFFPARLGHPAKMILLQ